MAPNPTIMQAVEQLDYRVTVGDVATQTGWNVELAQQGLLALASDAGGHLQVAETGDIVYLFPKNFRGVLRNKFLRMRLQEWWDKIWGVLFYLLRISFGIVLLVSIVLIFVTIAIILMTAESSGNNSSSSDRRRQYGGRSGGGIGFMPFFRVGYDPFWFFYPNYRTRVQHRRVASPESGSKMNFLEAVFSFLFGDGNPNANLEERRWQEIATVIRNNRGAVVAEQIAPYLDDLGQGYSREYEDYMLPVLSRFNGIPAVSPEGGIVYHFPELQTTAQSQRQQPVSAYLKEQLWQFSQAESGQIIAAIGLGLLNFVGALILGSLLTGELAAELGGLVALVNSIYWVLLAYGVAFLVVPLIRYFWIKWRNHRLEVRNQQRQERAILLNQADADIRKKMGFAQQFAAENAIGRKDLTYTTETDLIDQDIERADEIDREWQRRLDES